MIGPRFSAAAKTYDHHAQPQQALAESVVSMLPENRPQRILELGAGTGLLTKLLMERFPCTPIDAIDLADKMVEYSREKFRSHSYVHWTVGDAQSFRTEKPYALIASSSALHWTSSLRKTCANIYQCLESGGTFALGMMLRGTLGELHDLRHEIAPGKTGAPELPSHTETLAALEVAGFQCEHTEQFENRCIYPNAAAFLRAIHEQGVTGNDSGTPENLLTRSEISRLRKEYQIRFATENGVYATYKTATYLLSK